jgi:sulfur-oxidizing protein SoxY
MMGTTLDRRTLLKAGGGMGLLGSLAAAGFLPWSEVLAQQPAWNALAFSAKSMANVAKALGWSQPLENKAIQIAMADIAENGQQVPVAVTSSIPKTEAMALLVEKNPNMLSAVFNVPPGTDAYFSTRIKMGESSDVYALVRSEGRVFFARKEVRITLGGCG